MQLAAGRAVLLRPGGLAVEAIEAEIGPLEVPDDGTPGTAELAPGRAGAHYAPRAPLELADPRDPAAAAAFAVRPGERVGLLAASDAGLAAAVRANFEALIDAWRAARIGKAK